MFSGLKTTACLTLFDTILPTKGLVDIKVNKKHYTTNINVTSGK